MTLLRVKTCGESEFDIFETKKRFSDSGKAVYWSEKYQKCDFYLKTTPFGIIMCGEFEFDIFEAKKVSLIQGKHIEYWSENRKISSGGIFMWGIECARFRDMKKFSWHWFKISCWKSLKQYIREIFSCLENVRNRFIA
jgi:hypothetical protein